MALRFIQTFNFHNCLYENNALPAFYECSGSNGIGKLPVTPGLSIVRLIPPYIKMDVSEINSKHRRYTFYNHIDYLIDLSVEPNSERLFRSVLGGRNFKNRRREHRRLLEDTAFKQQIYFGAIDEAEYFFIMDRFKAMIKTRFTQRNMKHDALERWDEYMDTTYGRILEKKASLFVYYNKLQPIAIGLNFHREQALFSAITTYDIQYHKYGLGLQLLMAKIEWAYELGIRFVDLGWGDLEHKKALANRLETYRTDVVYPVGKPWLKLLAFVIVKAMDFKRSLRKLKANSRPRPSDSLQ